MNAKAWLAFWMIVAVIETGMLAADIAAKFVFLVAFQSGAIVVSFVMFRFNLSFVEEKSEEQEQ